MRPGTRRLGAVVLAAALFALAACSGSAEVRGPRGASAVPHGTIVVLADTALGSVLNDLGGDFQNAHPGTEVKLSLGASGDLAARVAAGQDGDVLITADKTTMDAAGSGVTAPSLAFARTQLVIGVAPGNPKQIASLADLTARGLRVVLCAATAPCGAAAQALFAAAGVVVPTVTRVPDVGTAVARLKAGKADAALVYRSDAQAAGDAIDTVEFPESSSAVSVCQAAAIARSANAVTAQAFVDFLHTPAGQDRIYSAGFQLP